MPSHMWGDEDFDWESLNHCCHWFPKQLRRWGRIDIAGCKEKYGTMRLEWFFFGAHHNHLLHSLLWPGSLFIHWPKKPTRLVKRREFVVSGVDQNNNYTEETIILDAYNKSLWRDLDDIITAIARYSGISWLFDRYQRLIFNIITIIAVKKWSSVREEITDGLEFDGLLYKWVKKHINYACHWENVE